MENYLFSSNEAVSYTHLDVYKRQTQKHVNIAFRTKSSLGRYIKNNKSKVEKFQKSGVYELSCGSCDKIYIGQSGRSFSKRMYDHNYSLRYQDGKSNYANHLSENDHNFNDNFKILHVWEKGKKLDLLEALEINKRKDLGLLLNNQTDLNSSPLLNLKLYK